MPETTPPAPTTTARLRRGCIRTFLPIFMIIGGIIACSIGMTVLADVVCYSNASTWIPYYPNAEVVSESYTLFRPFGMGRTRVVLRSDDSSTVVGKWYYDYRREQGLMPSNMLASVNYHVQPQPEGGVRISLSSSCASW